MTNHRLRQALTARDMTVPGLAERVGVDAKSVERWITQDRRPRPATRVRVAALLGHQETFFWPELLAGARTRGATGSELVQIWPTRDVVPAEVWRNLAGDVQRELCVLVYSGGFLVETVGLAQVLTGLSRKGAQARVLLGDPLAPEVARRGRDEGLPSLSARCASTAEYLAPVLGLPGVQVRTHTTPLYASLYGCDDAWLVNTHSHGVPAMSSPVLHLERVPGGRWVDYYAAAFERVWQTGKSLGE